MCGICAMITRELNDKNLYDFLKIFKHQESRGGDSTGLYLLTPEKSMLYWSLEKEIKPIVRDSFKDLEDSFGQPCLLMGHTRKTATGKTSHFHPAISDDGKVIIVHNNTVEDDFSLYYHENDTYHLANVLANECTTKQEKRDLKNRLSCSGSSIIIFYTDSLKLDVVRWKHNPLELVLGNKEEHSYILCSIVPSGYPSGEIEEGFYTIDLKEELFNGNKEGCFKFQEGIKFIRRNGTSLKFPPLKLTQNPKNHKNSFGVPTTTTTNNNRSNWDLKEDLYDCDLYWGHECFQCGVKKCINPQKERVRYYG